MNGRIRHKSELATVERITNNKTSPRNKTIRRLTPHCVAGNLTVGTVLGLAKFHDGKTASTGYAIDSEGRCGLGVEETNRPWTTSSAANDHEAITFEIANTGLGPDWRMSDAAINAFLDQAVETCRFYGYSKAAYQLKPKNITGSVAVENWIKSWHNSDEMAITLHNWYANKACPGPYFMRQIPWLVREMNKRLQNPSYIPERFVGEGATWPTIKRGSVGEAVIFAQEKLNAHNMIPEVRVDGHFGPLTEASVKVFQAERGLVVDGSIGPMTWAELEKQADVPAKPSVPPSDPAQEQKPSSYLIRITASALNIRTSPDKNSKIVKVLINDKNAYTIVEEANGPGATKWGRLKSGLGWISLDHVVKV